MKFGLDQQTIDLIRDVILSHECVQDIIIYGSRTKGNYHPGSDIDLSVKGDISLSDLFKMKSELDELMIPYKIDLSSYNDINNQDLKDHIDRVGQLFN